MGAFLFSSILIAVGTLAPAEAVTGVLSGRHIERMP
jgi:hypothetical protein